MSRWEERSIKNDFNKAAAGQAEKSHSQPKPKLKPKPPKYAAPGLGGSGHTAWDQHTQRKGGAGAQKDVRAKDSRALKDKFNGEAKKK
ncbi:hypothetical protein [Ruegeria sp.]|uniref:hypothetical protein n=1 Tax=Ruegeria sp. TaxID=1879320 RepID=UPI003C7C531F